VGSLKTAAATTVNNVLFRISGRFATLTFIPTETLENHGMEHHGTSLASTV
jgi:hypothetical protein